MQHAKSYLSAVFIVKLNMLTFVYLKTLKSANILTHLFIFQTAHTITYLFFSVLATHIQ